MSAPDQPIDEGPRLRIGELSRRTGVPPETLRAWERRYGLVRPGRSAGGFRLYGRDEQRRVEAMRGLIDAGLSASEAARAAASQAAPTAEPPLPAELGAAPLREALERFDEVAAQAILDSAMARLSTDAVAAQLVLPVMREIGERWRSGETAIAQEHFATGVLRERMLALGRNWGAGVGPRALLACLPGELHDLGLIVFGVVLRERGWRITYLGADTPLETVADTADKLQPAAVVLAALDGALFEAHSESITALASGVPVLLGGDVEAALAHRLGARALGADPVTAALRTGASVGMPIEKGQ